MELLIVMAIMGMLMAMSIPSVTGYATQFRLKAAVRETVGLCSLARSSAIGSRAARTITIDTDSRTLTLEPASDREEPRRVKLGKGVDVALESSGGTMQQSEGSASVVFQPSGSLGGRSVSILLSNGRKDQRVRITGATGAISVE